MTPARIEGTIWRPRDRGHVVAEDWLDLLLGAIMTGMLLGYFTT